MSQSESDRQGVTAGRFELEHNGKTAFLEYRIGRGVLTLVHTEVPEELRGAGMGTELAHSAMEWARQNHFQVRVGCPFVASYLQQHPEYEDLLIQA
jgi:predicted GNAT family acetyltransferase